MPTKCPDCVVGNISIHCDEFYICDNCEQKFTSDEFHVIMCSTMSCTYKGCGKQAVGFDSWFNITYCEEHKNVPPAYWEREDS